MDDIHPIRLHISLTQARHSPLQVAAKRAGVSMNKLIDIAIADLLARIEREGALSVPLRPIEAQQ
jgi:hypothetical protein